MTKTLAALWQDRFAQDDPGLAEAPAPDPAIARLIAHRTHRRYTDAPVPETLMKTLLAVALSAHSKSDLQQVAIIRVRAPDRRAAIAAMLPRMAHVAAAPEFFIFCGDTRRIRRITEMRGKDYANDTMDSVLNATIDAALAMQSLVAAAEIMGLGCCAISHVRDHVDAIAELLEIPPGVFPISGLCLGWPAQEGFVSVRLPPALTVHTDRYDDSRLEDEIEGYDRRRAARYAIPPEKRRDPARFGEVEFYGWSEDKARQMADPDGDTMRAFLDRNGFALA